MSHIKTPRKLQVSYAFYNRLLVSIALLWIPFSDHQIEKWCCILLWILLLLSVFIPSFCSNRCNPRKWYIFCIHYFTFVVTLLEVLVEKFILDIHFSILLLVETLIEWWLSKNPAVASYFEQKFDELSLDNINIVYYSNDTKNVRNKMNWRGNGK